MTLILALILGSSLWFSDSLAEVECVPIELEYTIEGGDLTNICKDLDWLSVSITLISTNENGGNVELIMPKKYATSLDSQDCKTSPPLIIMNKEQILPSELVETTLNHIISFDFTEGDHNIEIVGFEILPRPSPSMLCGIVLGYDSQYLPPLKQTERDVELRFIQCNDDKQLVVKYDGSPACVKPENKSEFLKRGWSVPEKQTIFSKPPSIEFDEVKIKEISENVILSRGIGFDLPEDVFTEEDLKNLQKRELELRKIFENSDTANEERNIAVKEFNEMQLRLQNPFQTGVPYELAKKLQDKIMLRTYLVESLELYDGEYPEPAGSWYTSDKYQAIIIDIRSEYFKMENLKKYDDFVRKFLGNEINILYKR